jgi:predicted GIY-YIG superfamily endonuclease
MITYIYGLVCPKTKLVMYIGKSNNPKRRLKDHMIDFRTRFGEFRKVTWLLDLHRNKLKPELLILETLDMDDYDWKEREKHWIATYRVINPDLLNYKDGGNGLSVANDKSFKIGNIPWNKKI